jgi:hypothetical protein
VSTAATAKAAPAAEISTDAHPSLKEIDRPANLTPANTPGWGSDVIADALRDLNIPYIALNPGASYRGIHDSIVNYLGNETPQMILCLHEEVAVAIAHGYAKVTGKAMAAAVHSCPDQHQQPGADLDPAELHLPGRSVVADPEICGHGRCDRDCRSLRFDISLAPAKLICHTRGRFCGPTFFQENQLCKDFVSH